MEREEFIASYIFPWETQETILKYLNGEIDYDEEYIKEVANDNNIIITNKK